jgi:putative nucleotidyltransferase with HDIG domain
MDIKKIEKILNKIDAVPTLPIIATQLTNALQSKNSSSKEVAEIVKNDQALTVKVLKLVNSPFYGFSQKITTIQRAITLLGFDMISSLSLSISIFDVVHKNDNSKGFKPEEFWKHSLGVAITSQIIAESISFAESESVFVAGLLHDIGKVIEVYFMTEEFNEIVELLKKGEKYIDAEKKVLGVDHTYIGGVVANTWNLPQELINPIKHHHQYNKSLSIHADCLTITAIVHLADILVKTQMFGFSGDNTIPELIKDYWLVLNIQKEKLEKIIAELPKEFDKVMHLLNIIL